MAKTLSGDELAKVHAALSAGQLIQAIKVYREATGEGLKEAKDAVEAMDAQLRASSPERFAGPPVSVKRGCLPMLLLVVGVAVTGAVAVVAVAHG